MANKKQPKNEDEVKARPEGTGHDPLSGGERLYNDQNEESATHYRADGSELQEADPEKVEAEEQERIEEANKRGEQVMEDQENRSK